jgi:hypothetical protein
MTLGDINMIGFIQHGLVGTTKSEETRKAMSLAKLGVPKTEEHKEAIRAAKTGKTKSQATKDKTSAAMALVWAKRKEERAA